MTLYALLELPDFASIAEVKSAFRKLARVHHPDKSGKESSTFTEIQQAYEVLSEPQTKHDYDMQLKGANQVAVSGRLYWESGEKVGSDEAFYRWCCQRCGEDVTLESCQYDSDVLVECTACSSVYEVCRDVN